MKIILYLFSLLYIAAGVCLILYTRETRAFTKRIMDELGIKILAAGGIAFSLLLFYAAPAARNSWFVVLLGLLGIVKAGLFIADPHHFSKVATDWYLNTATAETYRFLGIVVLIIGTAVFSWI